MVEIHREKVMVTTELSGSGKKKVQKGWIAESWSQINSNEKSNTVFSSEDD